MHVLREIGNVEFMAPPLHIVSHRRSRRRRSCGLQFILITLNGQISKSKFKHKARALIISRVKCELVQESQRKTENVRQHQIFARVE